MTNATDQLDLFDQPTPADTRAQARQRIGLSVHHLQAKVLRFLLEQGDKGATDEEAADQLAMKLDTLRARRVELRDAKLVLDSGRRRPTRSGRTAIVWLPSSAAELPSATPSTAKRPDQAAASTRPRACNHTLNHTDPAGTWIERRRGDETFVECRHCRRYYGHLRGDDIS